MYWRLSWSFLSRSRCVWVSQSHLLPGALIAVVVTATMQLQGLNVNKGRRSDQSVICNQHPQHFRHLWRVHPHVAGVGSDLRLHRQRGNLAVGRGGGPSASEGVRTQYDRELAAQGGNMLCGFLGALPMTGVIVRSAANVQAGAATRTSTILHGSWLLVFVMLLPWLLRMTPVACLAGILVYTGVKMIKIEQVKELVTYGRGTAAIYLATTFAIVATDLLTGVLIGFRFVVVPSGTALLASEGRSVRARRQEGRDACDLAGLGYLPEGAGHGTDIGKRAAEHCAASGCGQAAPRRPCLHRVVARLEPQCSLARL